MPWEDVVENAGRLVARLVARWARETRDNARGWLMRGMHRQYVRPDWYEIRRGAEDIGRKRKSRLRREKKRRGPYGLHGWNDARVKMTMRFGEVTWRR